MLFNSITPAKESQHDPLCQHSSSMIVIKSLAVTLGAGLIAGIEAGVIMELSRGNAKAVSDDDAFAPTIALA